MPIRSIFIALLLVFATIGSAQSQVNCDVRSKVVSMLATKYQEAQVGFGLTIKRQQLLEIFTSKSGTWTILITRSDGFSCMMSAGSSWQSITPKYPPPET